MTHLSESIETSRIFLGENTDRTPAVIDDDDCVVSSFVNQLQSIANGVARGQRDRSLERG